MSLFNHSTNPNYTTGCYYADCALRSLDLDELQRACFYFEKVAEEEAGIPGASLDIHMKIHEFFKSFLSSLDTSELDGRASPSPLEIPHRKRIVVQKERANFKRIVKEVVLVTSLTAIKSDATARIRFLDIASNSLFSNPQLMHFSKTDSSVNFNKRHSNIQEAYRRLNDSKKQLQPFDFRTAKPEDLSRVFREIEKSFLELVELKKTVGVSSLHDYKEHLSYLGDIRFLLTRNLGSSPPEIIENLLQHEVLLTSLAYIENNKVRLKFDKLSELLTVNIVQIIAKMRVSGSPQDPAEVVIYNQESNSFQRVLTNQQPRHVISDTLGVYEKMIYLLLTGNSQVLENFQSHPVFSKLSLGATLSLLFGKMLEIEKVLFKLENPSSQHLKGFEPKRTLAAKQNIKHVIKSQLLLEISKLTPESGISGPMSLQPTGRIVELFNTADTLNLIDSIIAENRSIAAFEKAFHSMRQAQRMSFVADTPRSVVSLEEASEVQGADFVSIAGYEGESKKIKLTLNELFVRGLSHIHLSLNPITSFLEWPKAILHKYLKIISTNHGFKIEQVYRFCELLEKMRNVELQITSLFNHLGEHLLDNKHIVNLSENLGDDDIDILKEMVAIDDLDVKYPALAVADIAALNLVKPLLISEGLPTNREIVAKLTADSKTNILIKRLKAIAKIKLITDQVNALDSLNVEAINSLFLSGEWARYSQNTLEFIKLLDSFLQFIKENKITHFPKVRFDFSKLNAELLENLYAIEPLLQNHIMAPFQFFLKWKLLMQDLSKRETFGNRLDPAISAISDMSREVDNANAPDKKPPPATKRPTEIRRGFSARQGIGAAVERSSVSELNKRFSAFFKGKVRPAENDGASADT